MSYNKDIKATKYQLSDIIINSQDKEKLDKLQYKNIKVEQSYKIDLHKKILDNIHQMYIDKNHDYGDSVHDTFEKYGLVSFLVRMEDKLNRVRTLSKDNVKITDAKVQDEKIEDTLLDLANYAILATMELIIQGHKYENNNFTITRESPEQYDTPKISY